MSGDGISVNLNNDLPEINLNEINISEKEPSQPKSVNFGPGADMLMNTAKLNKPSTPKSSGDDNVEISINELDSINELGNDANKKETSGKKDIFSGLGLKVPEILKPKGKEDPSKSVSFDNKVSKVEYKDGKENGKNDPILKGAFKGIKLETDDGFKKFNNIPVNPTQKKVEKKLSPQQELKEKFKFLRRLEALEEKGISLSKRYSMESSLSEMKGEYEMIKSEMEKKSSVKFQGKMLMAAVSALEFLNNKFDPFDLKLDGWSESVTENLDEYDDVFGELHEKYGGKANIAPELKLLFMIGGSGLMLHMTNTMFKSAMPGMDDIMRQNPELMQQFTSAAVNSMGSQNSGFGNFMSSMMPPPSTGRQYPPQMNAVPPRGSPPGPDDNMKRNPPQMPQMRSRPDIAAATQRSASNDAVNIENTFSSLSRESQRSKRAPRKEERREMQGPGNIKDILSGLKTKQITLKTEEDKNSTVSVSEIKELNADMTKQKKSRRRVKSDKNVVSLNI